jgi:hypothetical protein
MPRKAVLDLTDDTITAIAQAYREGVPMDQAAAIGRIHVRTLSRWLRSGQDELARLTDDPTATPSTEAKVVAHVRLVRAIKEADADFVRVNLERISRAADGGQLKSRTVRVLKDGTEEVTETYYEGRWMAAAWNLERRHTEDFGRQIRASMEISGPSGGPVQSEVTHVDQQSLAERGRARLMVLRPGSPTTQAEDTATG